MKTAIGSMKRFACDLWQVSPRRAARAALLIVLGALIELASLGLLIPLLNLVFAQAPHGVAVIAGFWHFRSAHSTFTQLGELLGLYVGLAIARAIVFGYRDVAITRLQLAFTDGLRARLADAISVSGRRKFHQQKPRFLLSTAEE